MRGAHLSSHSRFDVPVPAARRARGRAAPGNDSAARADAPRDCESGERARAAAAPSPCLPACRPGRGCCGGGPAAARRPCLLWGGPGPHPRRLRPTPNRPDRAEAARRERWLVCTPCPARGRPAARRPAGQDEVLLFTFGVLYRHAANEGFQKWRRAASPRRNGREAKRRLKKKKKGAEDTKEFVRRKAASPKKNKKTRWWPSARRGAHRAGPRRQGARRGKRASMPRDRRSEQWGMGVHARITRVWLGDAGVSDA